MSSTTTSAADPETLFAYGSSAMSIGSEEDRLALGMNTPIEEFQRECTEYDVGIGDFYALVDQIHQTAGYIDVIGKWIIDIGFDFLHADTPTIQDILFEVWLEVSRGVSRLPLGSWEVFGGDDDPYRFLYLDRQVGSLETGDARVGMRLGCGLFRTENLYELIVPDGWQELLPDSVNTFYTQFFGAQDIQYLGVDAEASIGQDGATLGAQITGAARRSVLGGDFDSQHNNDQQLRIGPSVGAGLAGRLHWDDSDNDGYREYGFGADFGIWKGLGLTSDLRTEDPLFIGLSPLGGVINSQFDIYEGNLTHTTYNAVSEVDEVREAVVEETVDEVIETVGEVSEIVGRGREFVEGVWEDAPPFGPITLPWP